MKSFLFFFYLLLIVLPLMAQERIDEDVIARIKEEGIQYSQVMNTISYLTDVYGSLLLGTPEYREAADWIKQELSDWGIDRVKLESFDQGYRGWRANSFSIEMLEPHYLPIFGYPKAWSNDTQGEIIGHPIIVGDIYHLDSLTKYEGQLKDKIVLVDLNYQAAPSFEPFSYRRTVEKLKIAESNLFPFPETSLNPWEGKMPLKERMQSWKKDDEEKLQIQKQLIVESPAVLIEPSSLPHGMIRVTDQYLGNDRSITPVPAFVIAQENFSRLQRMMERDIIPTLKIHLKGEYFQDPEYNVNVIAEIPGNDKKKRKEVVMIGAHLDSWHSGTGATDNSANCAVLMEVMRIFKILHLKPRRTIRMGLWGGEEGGYYGSRGYVALNVGDLKTGTITNDEEIISVYLNLDNGAGKIRGLYLQGNEAVRPIFSDLLKPFNHMGVGTLAIEYTTHTDHEVFDAMNIPAFQFIQDLNNYITVTHHSNMDVYDYLIEEDIKQNVVIVASLLYHLAMRDDVLPRKKIKNQNN